MVYDLRNVYDGKRRGDWPDNPDPYAVLGYEAPPLWTPAQRATRLWLDFADTSTYTVESAAISGITDKSGNAIAYSQATAASRPSYLASSVGGLPAASFDGSNDFMDSTASIQPASNEPITLLFSGQRNGNGAVFTERQSTVCQSFSYYLQSGSDYTLMTDGLNVGSRHLTTTVLTGNIILVYQHVPGERGRVWANGTELTISAGTCSTLTGTAGSRIGRRQSPAADYWNGLMFEIVAELTTLSTDTRQLYEGYFAWRRGIQSVLPSDHPYRNVAPVL